jgi:hypothetical protein
MGPFVEAVGATFQPCTFLLIVPVVVASFVASNRWWALVAIWAAAVVGGWLVAANWFVLDGVWIRLAALGCGLALLAVAAPAVGLRPVGAPWYASEPAAVSVAGMVTLAATMWWRPCVGDELGLILTGAQHGLGGELLPMAIYMTGAVVPIAIVVLARDALDPPERATRVAALAALGVGLVVMFSLVVGQHDRVVVTLTRWTLE